MGWQRRLYAKEEPSKGFRAWTGVLGSIILLTGIVVFYFGLRFYRGEDLVRLAGAGLMLVSLLIVFAGLAVVFMAMMRWTNPVLGE
ncbi:MAG TPA: hypothetical protein VI818_01765, partial [Candidatus Thermoplasmatota archaeon]|nr:hypothetical protein [Candidatus Thermoplasmatota archaeon]